MSLRTWPIGAVIGTLMLVQVPTATAVTITGGDSPIEYPPGLSASEKAYYASIVGDQGSWSPQGTVVARSEFDPKSDGFSFMNYGDDLTLNELFFAQPRALAPSGRASRISQMTSRDLRIIYGDRVCLRRPTASGSCALTESARQVLALANEWGKAGHCAAMTTLAAGRFNNWVKPTARGLTSPTYATRLNSQVQRVLARHTVVAHFSTTGFLQTSMTGLLSRLTTSLNAGQIPNSVLIFGDRGGHAVLPVSVLDRGGGLFDIGVYDPNVPGQERAIHVDTNANSWAYESLGAPGQPPLTWSSAQADGPGRLYLGIMDRSLGKQECPFCAATSGTASSASKTVVSFSPVHVENAAIFDSISLTDSDGAPSIHRCTRWSSRWIRQGRPT